MKLDRSIITMAFCAAHWLVVTPCLRAENGGEFEDSPIEEVGPMMPSTLPRDASLELPEWHLADLREFDQNASPVNLGGGLWPAELWPLMPVPMRLPSLLPTQLPLPPSSTVEGELLEPMQASLRELYFGSLPPESVVDPQSLLNEVQQEDLCRFFEEYAVRQTGVEVRFLVLGGKQEVPTAAELQTLTNQWFPSQLGLVVVYPMGQPKGASCYFSSGLQMVYSADQLNSVREACSKEAAFATREEDQLSRYGIKLAVRMNRLKDEPKPAEPAPPVVVVVSIPFWQKHWIVPGLVSVLGLTAVVVISRVTRRRVKEVALPQVWLFPDQDISPRLNAPHCGGTMAVMKFRA